MNMQSRAYDILEMFRPRRSLRRRFRASSTRGLRGEPGNVMYRRRFTLPTGRYVTEVIYVPQTRELSVNWTFNGRIIPLPGVDTRSSEEKQQARRDVSFIFQYLFDLIDHVVHNFNVSAILFESHLQHPSKTRLYDRFARKLVRDYGGSIEKSEPTPLLGVIQYTIRLHEREGEER